MIISWKIFLTPSIAVDKSYRVKGRKKKEESRRVSCVRGFQMKWKYIFSFVSITKHAQTKAQAGTIQTISNKWMCFSKRFAFRQQFPALKVIIHKSFKSQIFNPFDRRKSTHGEGIISLIIKKKLIWFS